MVVLDPEGESSILDMKEVEFVNGKPKVKQFIDNYPFPFYVIVKHLDALPDVLGDAVKQWWQMLARQR